MPTWKVLLIGFLFFACLGLATATIVYPLGMPGNDRWIWMGGLAVATLAVGGLLAWFLKIASAALDGPRR